VHVVPPESLERLRARSGGAPPDPEIGRLVDRYLIVEKLGQGGMGAVFLALQMPLARPVALKMVAGIVLDPAARQRFEREAKAVSILYHPNIVSLVDFGFDPATGAPFMALEYVRGGIELGDEMERLRAAGEAWGPDAVAAIFTQVLSGLSVAHTSGLIHRDIKPPNIMLTSVEGTPRFVKILDFGLARALEELPGLARITVQGAIMGTPQYMAPEQIAGKGGVDHRCDLYAVGAILFELLVQRPLYDAATPREIFTQKLDPLYEPAATIPQDRVGPPLARFLGKALARDPGARFQNAGEMKEALVRALDAARAEAAMGAPARAGDIGYAPTIQLDRPPTAPPPAPVPAAEEEETAPDEPPAPPHRGRRGVILFLVFAAGAVAAALILLVILPLVRPPAPPGADAAQDAPVEAAAEPAPEAGEAEETAPVEDGWTAAAQIAAAGVDGDDDGNVDEEDRKGKRKRDAETEGGTAADAGQETGGAAGDGDVADAGGGPAQDAGGAIEDAGGPAQDAAPPDGPAKADVKKAYLKIVKRLAACCDGPEGVLKGAVTFDGATGKVKEIMIVQESLGAEAAASRECAEEALRSPSLAPFGEGSFTLPVAFRCQDGKLPGILKKGLKDKGQN